MNKSPGNVGLFISCMVDFTRPQIGFAAIKLLEQSGCQVFVPSQTCCSQPAYNNGNRLEAIEIAKTTITAFEGCKHVIVPSASCAGMIKYHYPALFKDDPDWREKAQNISNRTHELVTFLYSIAQMKETRAAYNGPIYFHQSCSARREMKCEGAQELLQTIEGAQIIEMPNNEACCGFGGLFSVKYDEISNAMVSKKIVPLPNNKEAILTGLDLGCLLNMAGKLHKQGNPIQVRHIAELLAGEFSGQDISPASV